MYVTRPRSIYKEDPTALSLPPEDPNSGYLVIQDEEAETYCCFGMCKNNSISHLPFPQNKDLTVTYTQSTGQSVIVFQDKVVFIPVLNQPLSSNRYYVIRRHGKHQGEASTGSLEEDMGTCLCCSYVKNVKPKSLDPFNVYQQFEMTRKRCGFSAKSVAQDGFPPLFLRRKGWKVSAKTPHHYHLEKALGLNSSLRTQLPELDLPISKDHSEFVVIGKWYVPFMFVKEEMKLKDQMKTSVFYEMTLQQRWEKIFSKENSKGEENEVFVDVDIGRKIVMVGGKEGVEEGNVTDGVLWFKSSDSKGGEISVGLNLAVVERMKWEQERGGWVDGKERQVRLERVEKFEGTERWKSFGCYVLVERFALNRMDGSFVLTYDFRHTHQIRCKWE